MRYILERIYGKAKAADAFNRIMSVVDSFQRRPVSEKKSFFSEKDAVLITYGDSIRREGEPPLRTLHRFAKDYLTGVFSGIHILPFFPYSSDDGFSVTDFFTVRPDLGDWEEIRRIGRDFQLMIDLVVNHISAQSRWFKRYLAGEKAFRELAIETDPGVDLSRITRPRSLPLLTEFEKTSGARVHLWTTFSADQIDLNYRSLDVLENMVRALIFYVSQNARYIRLDAIAYLWKQIGTPCIHLPQTHDMVRLFRKILDLVAPQVRLITETNVPHHENTRYFGNGRDEAQMVYNFTLPPLLLYSLIKGNSRIISEWAGTLCAPTSSTTFFNFTASHDGIGVRPLEGILAPSEISNIVKQVLKIGGQVSSRHLPDGSESPYELNCTYLDALKNPASSQDPFHIARFLASQAAALALPGVPAVYLHSLLGSRNWIEGVRRTGRARTINRQPLALDPVCKELANRLSFRARVFHPYREMVRIRTGQPAFHPASEARVVDLGERVFAIERRCPQQTVLALTNMTAAPLTISIAKRWNNRRLIDLLNAERIQAEAISLQAYATRWLEVDRIV